MLFNSYLDTLQLKVFEAKRKLIEIDKPVTPNDIKDLIAGKGYQWTEKNAHGNFSES